MLGSAAPVTSVPTLSLEPEFSRSHGSLYKELTNGRIDADRLRRLLVGSLWGTKLTHWAVTWGFALGWVLQDEAACLVARCI